MTAGYAGPHPSFRDWRYAALAAAAAAGLRSLGITADHPWIRRMASRPWRDGQDVLRIAMRHLSDVFVVTPSGARLAPNVVELQLNPDDLGSLCDRMELGVLCASMTEVCQSWRLPERDLATGGGMVTIMEPGAAPIPVLRLVTGSSVAETRMSGARAGRGAVELVLPDVPTVSRQHARFTFSGDRWWITNQGRNGLLVNGAAVAGEQPLSDGDAIRWGSNPDAPLSRVEIG